MGLEAYPIEVGEKRAPQYAAYVGTTTMFENADSRSGKLPRWLKRLDLASD